MAKIILKVGGMSCSACSNHVEKYLKKSPGVIDASVNLVLGHAFIEYADTISIVDLKNYITNSGYEYLGIYDAKKELKSTKNNIKPLIILSIIACLLMYISMAHMFHLPLFSFLSIKEYPKNYALTLFILTIPFLIYSFDILKNGFKNLIHKSPNMDTLVSIGVISSFFYSFINMLLVLFNHLSLVHNLYFESSAIVLLFIKIGRYIDHFATLKTTDAIKELVTITPSKALVKEKDTLKEVTIDEVQIGDILVAKPGMKIAVDGTITKGSTHLDEAFITGESTPSKKEVESKVIAGSLNLDGYIEYQAENIGKNSTISEIVDLVLEATSTKAPIARLADKISSYFVPLIMLISLLTFIGYLLFGLSFKEALISFVTVLVVACPCALGLATPLAIVVSEGKCAQNGILIKNSTALEATSKIDTVIFDKTGTLTYGSLKIAQILNYSSYSDNDLITLVASLEANSTHPIASSFLNYAKDHHLNLKKVTNFENLDGLGLKGIINHEQVYVGNSKLLTKLKIKDLHQEDLLSLTTNACSIVYIIKNQEVLGLIGVKDVLRKSAPKVIHELNKLNINVYMLTGDNYKTAKIIAENLGIKNVKADVLPKEKAEFISKLLKENHQVLMMGDGINDAPSLAKSTIGVSIYSGTDIASNSADVVLMTDNLNRLIDLLQIGKKTIKVIKENLFWAYLYNILMLPLAIGLFKRIGLSLNPMIASLAMTCSSLTVVLNSLRLKIYQNLK